MRVTALWKNRVWRYECRLVDNLASLTVNTSELGKSDITWSWGGSSGEHTSSDVGLSSQLLCLKLLSKTDISLSQSIRYTKSWRFNPKIPNFKRPTSPRPTIFYFRSKRVYTTGWPILSQKWHNFCLET